MFNLNPGSRKGVLREGWSATVGDYAIAGGWARNGDLLIVGDAAGGVSAFDGKSGKTSWGQTDVHDGGVLAMAIHPSGNMFATSGQDGRVLLWSALEDQPIRTIEIGNSWVEHLSWSPNGKWLAASCSRQVRAYDVNGTEVWRSDDHPSTISAIAWWGVKELATACYGRVAFFNVAAGELRQTLEWKGSLVSMVLSPDEDIVACGSQDHTVHFWRRSTGEDSAMSGYPNKPSTLAFDEAGTLLATGGGPSVTVWSFRGRGPEGTTPGVLEFHEQPVTTLTFAPSGMRLASGARDGTVAVWTLTGNGQGRQAGTALVADAVAELLWRPDGHGLVALDAQGGVTAWRVGK